MSRQVVHTVPFERPHSAPKRERMETVPFERAPVERARLHTVPFERALPAPPSAALVALQTVAPPTPAPAAPPAVVDPSSILEDLGSPIGRVIGGKYVVDAELGEGSCAKVYRARQVTLDRPVAIKILHRALCRQPAIVERFHREARAASKLDHPNLVRVLDFGQEPDGLLYLVMDYVPGQDLEVVLRDGVFDARRIAIILCQTLAALAVAHERGIVHRDLKPENILLVRGVSDDGEEIDVVKVCDFGVATLATVDRQKASPLTEHGMVVGTPEYMSPEQARGDVLDARSDLYAIGAILYQLLTGRTPFVSTSPLEIAIQHLTARVVPPSQIAASVDLDLERICLKALAKDRNARFASAREMRAELRALMSSRGSKLPPLPSSRPPAPAAISAASPIVAAEVVAAEDSRIAEEQPFSLQRQASPLRFTAGPIAFSLIAAVCVLLSLGAVLARHASAQLQRQPFTVTATAAQQLTPR